MRSDGDVVIMRPYIDYARLLMPLLWDRYRLRTVAVFTDPVGLRKNFGRAPELRAPYVAASYLADEDRLDAVVDVLRERHDIRAVLPVGEADVLPLARIADALGLEGSDLQVRSRFRDKAALKEFLRSVPGGPRVNVSLLVRTPDDVRAALAEHGLGRAVLKPNAGVSNRDVLYVGPSTPDQVLERYFRDPSGEVLLEEYVDGTEYFVNGQVDEAGVVHVFSVNQYVRRTLNGREGVSTGDFTVATSRPEFAIAADYAREVLRPTGLRRSPFHLELKIDDRGPCLIEVAARFCGAGIVLRDSDAHGGLDVLGIGAHHYLSAEPYGDYALDWREYDAHVRGLVQGIGTRDQRILSLAGARRAEAMPEFVRWDTRPRYGDHVVPTVDFATVPWRATVSCQDEEHFHRTSDRMRAVLAFDSRGGRRLERVQALPALVPQAAVQAYGRLAPGLHLQRIAGHA